MYNDITTACNNAAFAWFDALSVKELLQVIRELIQGRTECKNT